MHGGLLVLYLNSQFENFKSSSPRQIRDAELICHCGSIAMGVRLALLYLFVKKDVSLPNNLAKI